MALLVGKKKKIGKKKKKKKKKRNLTLSTWGGLTLPLIHLNLSMLKWKNYRLACLIRARPIRFMAIKCCS